MHDSGFDASALVQGDVVPQLEYIDTYSGDDVSHGSSSAGSSAATSPRLQFLPSGAVVVPPGPAAEGLSRLLNNNHVGSGSSSGSSSDDDEAINVSVANLSLESSRAMDTPPPSYSDVIAARGRSDPMPTLELGPSAADTSSGTHAPSEQR